MNLTAQQEDALVELINIGFGRAAAALSELTGQRVLLDVPHVTITPLDQLRQALDGFVSGDIATVHQIFGGQVAGDAMLVLSYEGAVTLVSLLMDDRPQTHRLDASDREALTEVGNIILNTCLSTFGNMLQARISFAVPRLQLDSLNALLNSLLIGADELRYTLIIFTNFRLRDSAVSGYLVIILGVASLDRLIEAVEGLG